MSLHGVSKDAIRMELLRRRGKDDPAVFGQVLSAALRWKLAPYQLKLLRSASRYVLLNCCRQAGKSTGAALLALWTCIFKPGALVVVFAQAGRQSNEVLVAVQRFLSAMPERPDLKGDSVNRVAFKNGSRILCLPSTGATVRGFAADLVIMDEAGMAPDALFRAVAPMISAKKGRLVLMSTPNGEQGFFWSMWTQGGPKWDRIEAPWQECPWHAADPDEIAMQRMMLQELFPQEYECKFLSATLGSLYAAFNPAVNVIQSLPPADAKLWGFLLGLDFGVVNHTAFVVCGWLPQDPCLYVVHSESSPGLLAPDVGRRIEELRRTWPIGRIVGDEGGIGKGYMEQLRRFHFIAAEAAEKQKKAAFVNVLNGSFAMGRVKIVGPSNMDLISQIRSLQWNSTRTNHKDGQLADLADAFLYGWRSSTAYLQEPPAAPKTREERLRQETKDFWDRVSEDNRRGKADGDAAWDVSSDPWDFQD